LVKIAQRATKLVSEATCPRFFHTSGRPKKIQQPRKRQNRHPHPPKPPIPKNQPPQFSGKIQSQIALTRKTPRNNS
jgi:hypothetical protein